MSTSPARFVIIDAHAHAFRAFYALAPMTGPEGLPINAIYGLAGQLKRILFEEQPEYVAIVFDPVSTQRQNFRCDLYPAYKATRSERPADLQTQLPLLREVARAFGLHPFEHERYEADDYIASLVVKAEAAGLETTILSADKDLMQLVSPRTRLWDTMRGNVYTPEKVEEKLGVKPNQVADYLALVGDTSDNIPGVSGIGPRSASKLLDRHDTLEGIYDHLALCSPKERAKLEAGREMAFLSRELTRLRTDAPMVCAIEELVRPPLREFALDAMCERFGLRTLRNELRFAARLSAAPPQAAPSLRVIAQAALPEDLPLDNLELWGDESELRADGFPEVDALADSFALTSTFEWDDADLPFGPEPDTSGSTTATSPLALGAFSEDELAFLGEAPSTTPEPSPELSPGSPPPDLLSTLQSPTQLVHLDWFLETPSALHLLCHANQLTFQRSTTQCQVILIKASQLQVSLFDPTPVGISGPELLRFLERKAPWVLEHSCEGLSPEMTLKRFLGQLT